MPRFLGIVIVLLAIGIALIPQFSNCQFEGKSLALAGGKSVPMKCLWSARAELAIGISLIATGAMITSSRRKESRRNLAILGLLLSIFVILIPTSLIGVCQSQMLCNTFMRPSLLILGSISSAISVVSLITTQKSKGVES
jgi:FlaA1/EpsC-like NDP-sugar epimerase